jgi:hypothetical protein
LLTDFIKEVNANYILFYIELFIFYENSFWAKVLSKYGGLVTPCVFLKANSLRIYYGI